MIRALALAVALAIAGAAWAQAPDPAPVVHFDSLVLRDGQAAGQIYYTAHVRAAPEPGRPITFAFNGGPGAASIYLHLGGIGPTRIAANDNGSMPDGPVALIPNAESWFDFTDLVFVDPVGTGWSRALSGDTAPFWGIDQDAAWLARFVREYLARHPAEGRPIHLVGESYGGYRAIRVAQALSREGIAVAGLVLISPVIDFATIQGDGPQDLIASTARLPAYAAAAWAHGRAGDEPRTPESRAAFLAEVERFAIAEYLPALAMGDALPAAEWRRILERVARFTGIDLTIVTEHRGRVPREIFVRRLLFGENRTVGFYDASLAARGRGDPSLAALVGRLGPAADIYFAKVLRVTVPTDPYIMLNRQAPGGWDYVGRRRGVIAPPVGSDVLARLLLDHARLRVLVVNGRHDLVTTYFGTALALRQMRLTVHERPRLTHLVTDGGHMMYLNAAARAELVARAREHYAPADRAP